jgi:hypothetical protein
LPFISSCHSSSGSFLWAEGGRGDGVFFSVEGRGDFVVKVQILLSNRKRLTAYFARLSFNDGVVGLARDEVVGFTRSVRHFQ